MKHILERALTPDELVRGPARVEQALARRRRSRKWMTVGGLLPLVLSLAALAATMNEGPAPLLTRSDGSDIPSMLPAGTTPLSDGSSIRVHTDASLSLMQPAPGEVELTLSQGEARFDVHPGGPRRWSVRAGPLLVEVVGTSFSVTRDTRSASVVVHRGRVAVSASGVSRELYAGERFSVEAPESLAQRPEVEAIPRVARDDSRGGTPRSTLPEPLAQSAADGVRVEAQPRHSGSRSAVRFRAPQGGGSSNRGPSAAAPTTAPLDVAAAPASEPRAGAQDERVAAGVPFTESQVPRPPSVGDSSGASVLEAATTGPPSVSELLAASERARLEERPQEAVEALQTLVRLHPDAPEASVAAASLGALESSLSHPFAAARWYERSLELEPSPALAEMVYERLVRLARNRGDDAGARRWASRYYRNFPNGPRRAEIDSILAEP